MFTKTNAEAYFNAEKSESVLFLLIGIIAVAAAVIFFFALKTNFYKGCAIPLLLIGIIQVTVGYTVYARSDKQRIDIVYKMDMNPSAIKKQEIPRMETVMKSFTVYRYTEIALVITGAILFIYFRKNQHQQLWAGIGIALLVQALIMLFADGFAEKRGRVYLIGLEQFVQAKH